MRVWKRLVERTRRDDQGSALVLALIVITVIGIIMAAVLSFAGTGLLAAPQLRDLRNQNHYVAGAVDGAINNIRYQNLAGQVGSDIPACPPFAPPAPPASDLGAAGHAYNVTCAGQDSSGSLQPGVPRWAVLALGNNAGEGINQSNGNKLLTIDGGIYSHKDITVNGGSD